MGHIQHVLKRCHPLLHHPWRSSVLNVHLHSNHRIRSCTAYPQGPDYSKVA